MLPAQSAIKSPKEASLDETKAWWISSDNPKRQANKMAVIFIFAGDQKDFSQARSLAKRNARRDQATKWRTLS
jgi:hypothetical protein